MIFLEKIKSVYFIGAGGIGMSNLVRFFLHEKKNVAGYDRMKTDLTQQLCDEGAEIHYQDDLSLISSEYKQKETTLVVYTPAIPETHHELSFFKSNDYRLMKRAQVLGEISLTKKALCIAGTHGKTTTSSLVAHLLKQSHVDCSAFLGGIMKNYQSNLLLSEKSPYTVIEADEFDRSFHWLSPTMAVIIAADPDHLDIYGTEQAVVKSFEHFTSLIQPNGVLLMKNGLSVKPECDDSVKLYTYSMEEGDFYAENIRIGNGTILFDFVTPDGKIEEIELGVPLKINIENGVAAMALALMSGATEEEIRRGMKSFSGAKRRFDIQVKTDDLVYIDDYAHHPKELKVSIESVKALYPNKKITGIFQPHLYSRTRDFSAEFAESLSLLDEAILLEIYPAREEPIEGVTSKLILDKIDSNEKILCQKEELLELVENRDFEVLMTIGAGDIDRFVEPISKIMKQRAGV